MLPAHTTPSPAATSISTEETPPLTSAIPNNSPYRAGPSSQLGTSPAPPVSHGWPCGAARSHAIEATPPGPEPPSTGYGPSHSSRGGAGWGERGRALGPGLRHGLVSDKGCGYLSIVNGYSIKLTGGQRFPLDFESPQGRETKLQPPTLTLLKRKTQTKHKRHRCNLAARDGCSEAGRGGGRGAGCEGFRVVLGDMRGPSSCGARYSRSAVRSGQTLSRQKARRGCRRPLPLRMQDGKGAERL